MKMQNTKSLKQRVFYKMNNLNVKCVNKNSKTKKHYVDIVEFIKLPMKNTIVNAKFAKQNLKHDSN